MSENDKQGMLLGKQTPVVEVYAPDLLYPIPRSQGRDGLGLTAPLPFHGVDIWHAYEMSWLDKSGKPVVRVGRFSVPASSPNMVESKSFKLYLNSLNNTRFDTVDAARDTITEDISTAAGAPVNLALYEVADPGLAGTTLHSTCIDELDITSGDDEPDARVLSSGADWVEEGLHSHLLRSLCPVTGQPDWATVWIHYRGRAIDQHALLRYLVAYRRHQEFHEQCVERMYRDISEQCAPELLHLQAFYTRRGGLDISPFRSSDPEARPLPRLNRQ